MKTDFLTLNTPYSYPSYCPLPQLPSACPPCHPFRIFSKKLVKLSLLQISTVSYFYY